MNDPKTIASLAAALTGGGVVVSPTDTIYGILGRALDPGVVETIYRLKHRAPSKPFIILIDSIERLEDFNIPLSDNLKQQLQTYWPGPVSIILPCPDPAFEYLHRGTHSLAFRLPNNDNLRALVAETGPLIAPSANPEGLPPAENTDEARAYFGDDVAVYADGPTTHVPSKIIRITQEGEIEVIRP
jgi:L-threonylcarbamoyladenylate synthase